MARSAPSIEGLKVTILADNYVWANSLCQGQWGASYLIDVTIGGRVRRILLDCGEYAEPLLHNMRLLAIDPSSIEMVVLSHSHHDHTGGLIGLLEAMGRDYVPVIATPDIFKTSYVATPFFRNVAVQLVAARRDAKSADWLLSQSPMPLGAGITFSGAVARTTPFEPNRLPGLHVLDDGVARPYEVDDDAALYFETSAGLVIITGCAHAGIINTIKHGLAVTGATRPSMVIGGFHLTGATDQLTEQTIAALREYPGLRLVTGHCTGLKALFAMEKAFSRDLLPLSCGLVLDVFKETGITKD